MYGCSGEGDKPESENSQRAQAIIDSAIMVHGGEKYEQLNVQFGFRDKRYSARRNEGKFTYTRSFTDSAGNEVRDILNNEGFIREINGKRADLAEEREKAFTASVNSVIYFALLPYGLNDPAVNKEYLGETHINQEPYHKIKVSFDEEGGGEDFEDEYIYWIHKIKYTMDYLAYSFHVNGGGMRFRKALSPKELNGIRFLDYVNYKPASDSISLQSLDSLFELNMLEEVSQIRLENIQPL